MNKQGFTLVEMLLATVIAGILSTVLFSTLNQVQRSFTFIDFFVESHTNAALLYNRLEKDLVGATVPLLFQEKIAEKMEAAQATQKQKGQKLKAKQVKNQTPQKEKKTEQPVTEPQGPPPPKLTHIFYATKQAQDQLQILTCITSNPVRAYWSKKAGKGKPHLVRVVYSLELEEGQFAQDGQSIRTYKLLRQESPELEYAKFKGPESKIKKHELATGIASCKIKYTEFPLPPQPQKKGKDQAAAPPSTQESKEPKITTEWNKEERLAQIQSGQSGPEQLPGQQKQEQWIPNVVEVNLEFWDTKYTQKTPFVFTIPIITDHMMFVPRKKREIKKDDKKSPQNKLQGSKLDIPAKEKQQPASAPSGTFLGLRKQTEQVMGTKTTFVRRINGKEETIVVDGGMQIRKDMFG